MALKVGDTHEAVVIENVNRTHIVKYAGASGDFNPLHHDDTAAKGMAGYPSVFAHGMLSMGLTGRMLTDWVGRRRTCASTASASRSRSGRAIRSPPKVR